MAFTVQDFNDLVRLLDEHPQWQAELRRVLLADDFLALPQIVRELAEAQRRTEQHLAALADYQKQMQTDLGTLRGDWLEWRYVSRAPAYFGSWLRRVRVMLPASLDPAVEDVLEAKLTPDELLEILRLGALIQGRLRRPEQAAEEVWLAVEISAVIDQGDVERALRRAALLRKAGFPAIPVVAGESLTQGATEAVRDAPVAVLLDGKTMGWEPALRGGD